MSDEIKDATAVDQKLAEELNYLRPPDLLRLPPAVKEDLEKRGLHALLVAPENVDLRRWEGYEVVERPDVPDTKLQPGKDATQVDRTVRTREMVAMAIPKEKYEAMVKAEQAEIDRRARKIQETLDSGLDKIKHAAKRSGMSDREVANLMAKFDKEIGQG